MAHHVERRKSLLDDVIRSFQFATDGATAPQVSRAGETALPGP
jgi:hypothetical protein